LKSGAKIEAYDPAAIERARGIFKDKIIYAKSTYEAAENKDALIILTEWDQFRKINLPKIKKLLKNPIIIDGRNLFEPQKMSRLGFQYYSVGRK
jgi:UDPglucose 6-dehydrogenase